MNGKSIFIMRGTDKEIPFTRETGTFESGDKICFDVAKDVSSKNLIHKEITTFTEEGKTATLVLAPADTENLEPGIYVYDMLYVKDGKKEPLVYPSKFEIGEKVPEP